MGNYSRRITLELHMYAYDLPIWVVMLKPNDEAVRLFSYAYHDASKALLIFTDEDSVERFLDAKSGNRLGCSEIAEIAIYLGLLVKAMEQNYQWVVFDPIAERKTSCSYDIVEVYDEFKSRTQS